MAEARNQRVIHLDAIRNNLRLLRSAVPEQARMLAVVKADAYGHGAVQVSRAALDAGADWLAVATAQEGTALREAGIDAPVLVLGPVTPESVGVGVRHRLVQTVCTPKMLYLAEYAAQEAGCTAEVHLKLDTGMGRIGCREEEIPDMLRVLHSLSRVRLTGVFTHLADADGETEDYTRMQYDRFCQWTKLLPEGLIRHCANSAAITRYPEMALDMVRAGISLYGCPPVSTDLPLQPAMTWQAEITHVKTVNAGEAVSYGCTWHAPSRRQIATIACGYGDGYHRAATGKAQVVVHGVRCPVVGRICMDQMMADTTDVPGVRSGCTATLLGDGITAGELGAWAGTISYEVLLAATGRVERRWQDA